MVIINATTATLMPAKALCTMAKSAKFWRNAAIISIIINDGNTTPNVAIMPPIIPFSLYPIKVAVLTAITPGVHCPTA